MSGEIERLRALCRHWGGDLIEVSEAKYKEMAEESSKLEPFYQAPFSSNDLGIDWARNTVVYSGRVYWYEIVHEMGHIHACELNPDLADDEFNFFGWEYKIARLVGDAHEWMAGNKDYVVASWTDETALHHDFGRYDLKGQMKILRERIRKGKELGIISKRGKPLSIL